MGGAFARVPEDQTAFPNRQARYWLNIYGVWDDSSRDEEQIAWVREFFAAMLPHAADGMYLNFQGTDPGSDPLERARAAYGSAKLARLQQLKDRYDPDNVLRLNHNIPPTR
jgi:FAD/FMN-containing dehydrogenase